MILVVHSIDQFVRIHYFLLLVDNIQGHAHCHFVLNMKTRPSCQTLSNVLVAARNFRM